MQFFNASFEDAKNGKVADPDKAAFAANSHLLYPIHGDGAFPPLKKFSIRIHVRTACQRVPYSTLMFYASFQAVSMPR